MNSSATLPGRRLSIRFSIRTLMLTVTLMCVFLASWIATWRDGVAAANQAERTKYGELYMSLRTDPPRAVFPFVLVTGFTTTIHDTTTGNSRREPMGRRYYLWVGCVFQIGEWERSASC
ncbi:MAG: hypothetical protein HKN47_02065 [Pirellulaceae bacterium]|nr:hypothetical protein [Pirellulaceae bacterium]